MLDSVDTRGVPGPSSRPMDLCHTSHLLSHTSINILSWELDCRVFGNVTLLPFLCISCITDYSLYALSFFPIKMFCCLLLDTRGGGSVLGGGGFDQRLVTFLPHTSPPCTALPCTALYCTAGPGYYMSLLENSNCPDPEYANTKYSK